MTSIPHDSDGDGTKRLDLDASRSPTIGPIDTSKILVSLFWIFVTLFIGLIMLGFGLKPIILPFIGISLLIGLIVLLASGMSPPHMKTKQYLGVLHVRYFGDEEVFVSSTTQNQNQNQKQE